MDHRSHTIAATLDTVFLDQQVADQPALRRLYEAAKRDQWNASRDIPWESGVDLSRGVVADELIDIYGTPLWDRLDPRERLQLNHHFSRWRVGVLLYGEHAAMLVCSQLVGLLPQGDAKLFQATQVVDEARHSEVLQRYLDEQLGGPRYPLPVTLRELFDALLSDPHWPVKVIGLQLITETFAVALFRMVSQTAQDPLLAEICRRIVTDETRHMGFGMLGVPPVLAEMGAAERRELEDFTVWALERMLTGLFPEEVYRDLGLCATAIAEARALRRTHASPLRRQFRRELHDNLLTNLTRIGLLTERTIPQLQALGIRVRPA